MAAPSATSGAMGERRSRYEGRTLSIRDIPDFPAMDIFSGKATAPCPGFGGVIQDTGELERQFHVDAARVREEVRRIFRAELVNSTSIPRDLDNIVERMWETGWDPRAGDLNLFTHDFGLLLIEATLDLLGGRPIFRSPGDDVYIHNSNCLAGGGGVSIPQDLQVPDGDRWRIDGLFRARRWA